MTSSTATEREYLLPPDAYRSRSWFEDERARLFRNRWALIGAVEDFVRPGDFVAATLGDAPMLVVRDDDGRLRAFHNLCRHRGMKLLDGCGNAGRQVTCFYHHWRYGLSGQLEVVPQRRDQFPTLEPAAWGLLPASVEVWEGMVFVHPDPAAAPLADHLGELPAHLGSFRPGSLSQVATASFDIACNWKLFVENHIDVYHLWYLHDRSLAGFDHTKFEHRHVGEHWTSYEPRRSAASEAVVPIGHLAQRDRDGLGAHLIFPNTMIATAAEFFATYVAEPVGPDRTRLDLRIRAEEGAAADAVLAEVRSFIDEDVAACEAVQEAIGSPAFAVGPLARDHEAPIVDFHVDLLRRLRRIEQDV